MKITQNQIARKIAIRKAIAARDGQPSKPKKAPEATVTMDPKLLEACLEAAGYDEHASIAA